MRKDVAAIARFDANGGVWPLVLVWSDGRRFKVEKVTNVISLKDAENNPYLQYSCLIRSRESHVYYDGVRWFVDT